MFVVQSLMLVDKTIWTVTKKNCSPKYGTSKGLQDKVFHFNYIDSGEKNDMKYKKCKYL